MSIWRTAALKLPDFKKAPLVISIRKCPGHGNDHDENPSHLERIRAVIGNREIVGYGQNGDPAYIDLESHPFPSIRFREFGPELTAMREKEKGDWRTLTIDEKKCLYRASFFSTFAEMNATDAPEQKSALGWALIWVSGALWIYIFYQLFIRVKAPITFSPESRIAQYYRAKDINFAPIFCNKLWHPPGAEPRVHPKNQAMLTELMAKRESKQ